MSISSKTNKISKEKKRKKRNAVIICRSGSQFWTTQTQFWQWVRERVVIKQGNNPLTGCFRREDEELLITIDRNVLNLAAPNHLSEVLKNRKLVKS